MSSKKLRSLALLSGLVLLFTSQSFLTSAQSEPAEADHYIVRVEGLNPADYATIVKALRAEEQSMVHEACIPADMLCMAVPGGLSTEESFAQVKAVIATKTALQAELLPDFTFIKFREACNDARLGRTGQ